MPRGKPKNEPRMRQQGTGTVFWNSTKERYQASIELDRKPNGKRDRQTYTARLRGETDEAWQECSDWLELKKAEIVVGTFRPPSVETVKGFLEAHAAQQRDLLQWTERTYSENTSAYRLYVMPVIGSLRLNALVAADLNRVYARMLKTVSKRTGRTLSPNTVRNLHRVLHAALGDRLRWQDVKVPKAEDYEAAVLEPEHFTLLMEAARGTEYEPVWHLMAMALRPEEVLGIERTGIDYRRGTVSVVTVVPTKGPRVAKQPKSRRSRRTVSMPAQIMDELKAYCDRHAVRIMKGGGRIFCTDEGRPLSWATVHYHGWRPLWQDQRIKDAGIPYVAPYGLRHGFASYQIADGVDVATISADMGHSNTSITTRVYVHKLKGGQGRTAQTIGRLLPLQNAENEGLG